MRVTGDLPHDLTPGPGILPLDAEKEAMLRRALVDEARTWIGTPYRQLGDVKGIACDCSMLLVRCLVDTGIVEAFDPRPYPPTWFLHQADERYIDWLSIVAVEVETPQPGDFVTVKIGRAFAHSGIVSDAEHLIHAFADEGQVRESVLRHPRLSFMGHGSRTARPRRFYDLFARLGGR
jgi:NlpC/P60 family putative phage cell wall peptidase